jgi:hypothetical protein
MTTSSVVAFFAMMTSWWVMGRSNLCRVHSNDDGNPMILLSKEDHYFF